MPFSMPLTMPLALPTETAAASHDVFGEHMYYSQDNSTGGNNNNSMDLNRHMDMANMSMDLGLNTAMNTNMGMNMDVDMGALMHMTMPEDAHMGYSGFSYDQTSPCNAHPASTSSTPANTRQTTPPSMYLFNEPSMYLNSTASPYGDPPTSYSSASYSFNTSMAPTTLSSSYPSLYPPIQATTTDTMETTITPTVTAMPLLPSNNINNINDRPPLTRSRARHVRDAHSTHGVRSASDPIPSVEGRGRGHGHTRGASFDSADEDYYDESRDIDDMPQRIGPNINGPPPTDPADWRARLRYCEQATHKASLEASLVRLMEFPEGLDATELEARRAANLRFDRVREQRLKDRNNEAAKRSRQRKVARIEAAEQAIAALRRERAQLAGEVQQLRRQLAAAVSTSPVKTTQRTLKGRSVTAAPTTPRRRSSGSGSGSGSRPSSGSPNGRGKTKRHGSDESVNDNNEDDDKESEDDRSDSPRHGGSITVGILV